MVPQTASTTSVELSVGYLVCQHQNCFHGETTRAEIKQILQTGSKQVHD